MKRLAPKISALLVLIVVAFIGNTVSCASQELRQPGYYDDDFTREGNYPFSFSYGGQQSSVLLAGVTPSIKTQQIDEHVQMVVKEWKCKDGLVVTLSAKKYTDYDAAEWITYISYDGKGKSKVISDLYGMDCLFPINGGSEVVIHTNKGDDCTKYSYEPYEIVLKTGQTENFYPSQGSTSATAKSTTGPRGWPYWNIQNGKEGWIMAVGWPGAWQNEISRENDGLFKVKAGQKTFKAALKKGETVRTPLVCIVPWKTQDVAAAQNIWRRFYIDHVIPRFNGEPEQPATEIQAYMNEASISFAQKYIDAGIKPRICWKDAGWYPTNTGDWLETGEWKIDPQKYPKGIKPFTQWARKEGIETLLWFEPERVLGDNYISKNHKSWLLPIAGWKTSYLNIGNKDCLKWLIDHVDGMISENGLDWYREDLNNSGPYQAWIEEDQRLGKDRQGITENLYVQGHLAFWDSLKLRHPKLHIDACASGGRRNDLETMHRAVPLLRSDYQWANMGDDYIIGNQAHTWALSAWFPYQGSAVYEYEPYKYRSFYLPCFGTGGMNDKNSDAVIQAYTECTQIQPMMLYGDYWPLTPYSLEVDEWIAWQFNREDDGCVQAFRRENCNSKQLRVKLRGLDTKATYLLRNFDSKTVRRVSGRKLMRTGLKIRINEKPGAVVFVYDKVKK